MTNTLRKVQLSDNICVYRFGNPLVTGCSIMVPGETSFVRTEILPVFDWKEDNENLLLSAELGDDDALFGFGQHVGGINKRGRRLDLFCGQSLPHNPTNRRSNGNYPFFIYRANDKLTGFFFDFPSHIAADLGFEESDRMEFRVAHPDIDIYVYEGDHYNDICRSHVEITGRTFLPPLWAFGFHQCRYSYETEAEVRNVAEGFRSSGIPVDAIYMDIDYMDHYKVFSVNTERFPDLKGLISDMKADGVELVPIIDPGVKVEAGYEVYEEGIKENYFCTDAEGDPFTGAVWPGLTHFPDFLKPEVRKWWGDLYKVFTDQGIRGFWNDMNEPEIFYRPEELDALKEKVAEMDYTAFEDRGAIDFLESLSAWWQKDSYYDAFFQSLNGEKVLHRRVHNLYGMMMTRSVCEAFKDRHPHERFLLLSRASTAGSQRYGGVWTGDNHSWWEHLRLNIQMVISLGMAGQLYCGADIGGHCDEPDPELVIRWTQLGIFFPLFRNHTVKNSRAQEPYAFAESNRDILRNAIRLRYALLPYLYTEFMNSRKSGAPFLTPLFFHFKEACCDSLEDQFMVGNGLMAAPMLSPGSRHRQVYLPDGPWLHLAMREWNDFDVTLYPPGAHMVQNPLDTISLFLRENHLVLLTEPVKSTAEYNPQALHVIAFVTSKCAYRYYEDDGLSNNCDRGQYGEIIISAALEDGKPVGQVNIQEHGDYSLKVEKIVLELYGPAGDRVTQTISL